MTYSYDDCRSFFYINRLLDNMEDLNNLDETDVIRWANRYGLYKERKLNTVPERVKKSSYKKVRKLLHQHEAKNELLPQSTLEKNIIFAQQLFHLTRQEALLLEGAILCRKNNYLRHFMLSNINSRDFSIGNMAALANMPEDDALSLLVPSAPLMRFGLIMERKGFSTEYLVPEVIREFFKYKYNTADELKAAFLGKPLKSSHTPQDFAYVKETDFAVKLMQNAAQNKGFNILLYGSPGTGKTTFAQMLAARAKRLIYPVGEKVEKDRTHNYRLQELHQKTELLAGEPRSCLLLDEAEDIFSSRMTQCDKVEINRLLENNPCPVIWTTNHIERMDPAFIRRFTLAVHFEEPPVNIRQKIWRTQLKSYQLPCSYKATLALAKDFPVPPAMITGAARAASMVKGDLDTVRQHVEIMTQAMRGGRKLSVEEQKHKAFNSALINADTDLALLTKQIKKLGKLNFSLCLYGASGTGKSAYARYLADELGLEVRQERASTLISSFVGGTEENIAAAFARAKEDKSLLVFDEADSFLQDRSRARHSWEITAVNEMLTWMESHPYPFVCTTNLMDRLDAACLRRFSFKVKYGFLTAQQLVEAFNYFYKLKILPQQVYHLTSLTPGDFEVVKNKAEILGSLKDAEAIVNLLEEEQRVKQQTTTPKIGFYK